ncbi:MAG: polyphosphate kinase 1 [Gammaproteobacteria bacterium]|nr:polyphosphate kinase 1 [Gammaproteobacteria bacterium]
MDEQNFGLANNYINRELSLLKFNSRVLQQARDPSAPLLERLKFLCISCTNLDEFFEIRVGGVKQQIDLDIAHIAADGIAPRELLKQIHTEASELVDEQYRVFNEELKPELDEQKIRFVAREQWTPEQSLWLRQYFLYEVEPVLSPLGLDPAHPFPRIINKALNFIVQLEGLDAFGRKGEYAIVQAPRSLPRLIRLPDKINEEEGENYVFLSSVMHAFVNELFEGLDVKGSYQFRLTRNSDLFLDDEEIDDLMRALEGELASRRYGDAVRLEVANNCPEELVTYLLQQFSLTAVDLYRVNGPVNLNRLSQACDLVERSDLKYPPFTAGFPQTFSHNINLFTQIRQGDILLHHPYQSFVPVIDFVRQAAKDPKVLAIKQTLYRTGPDSPIVDNLVKAARAGKEVTVVIELMARFDEAANISLANRLQKAGAHVVYGIVGKKTHGKMILIVRRERDGLRRYAHFGTGNYHEKTTRLYTDYGMFTCDTQLTADAHEIFLELTSFTKVPSLNTVLQAPFTLYNMLIKLIDAEIEHAKEGRPARIIAKFNSLVEPQIIQALYRASSAGVKVQLIVRGTCCLRPGLAGISENIEVRSIVGRFLEHTRACYFHNNGDPKVFCSSADWMDRNFFRRVEVCWPIRDPTMRKRITDELEVYLKDSQQAWILQSDGNYTPLQGHEADACSAQQMLLNQMARSSY